METALLLSESVPREALAGDPPAIYCSIIPWHSVKRWEYLKYCKEYIKNNPDDITNKLIYRNILRSYARGL
jgi:hypothetical protein